MRTEAGVTTGRWVRLVLLCCTLVGLAAMHTLGHGAHASGSHGAHASGAQPADHAGGSVTGMAADTVSDRGVPPVAMASGHGARAVAVMLGLTIGCPGDGCGRTLAVPHAPSGGDLPGWGVCLAVLGAFAVVLLVAVLLRRRPVGVRSAPGAWPASGPRAPPPRPVGLRLATVSVLRR